MSLSESFAALIGRLLLGWFFLSQAVDRITQWDAMVILVQMKRVPLGMVMLALSLLAMIFGGFGLILGFQTRFSAIILATCTVSWVVVAHNYWTLHNPLERSSDYQVFALGVAIIGGLLCLAASGGGRFAIDAAGTKTA